MRLVIALLIAGLASGSGCSCGKQSSADQPPPPPAAPPGPPGPPKVVHPPLDPGVFGYGPIPKPKPPPAPPPPAPPAPAPSGSAAPGADK